MAAIKWQDKVSVLAIGRMRQETRDKSFKFGRIMEQEAFLSYLTYCYCISTIKEREGFL